MHALQAILPSCITSSAEGTSVPHSWQLANAVVDASVVLIGALPWLLEAPVSSVSTVVVHPAATIAAPAKTANSAFAMSVPNGRPAA